MCYRYLEYVTGMYRTSSGCVLEVFLTCFRYVVRHAMDGHCLDMGCICSGYFMDVLWTCFGHALDLFGEVCDHDLLQILVSLTAIVELIVKYRAVSGPFHD